MHVAQIQVQLSLCFENGLVVDEGELCAKLLLCCSLLQHHTKEARKRQQTQHVDDGWVPAMMAGWANHKLPPWISASKSRLLLMGGRFAPNSSCAVPFAGTNNSIIYTCSSQ
jgi:hypothetical protein